MEPTADDKLDRRPKKSAVADTGVGLSYRGADAAGGNIGLVALIGLQCPWVALKLLAVVAWWLLFEQEKLIEHQSQSFFREISRN